MVEKPLFSAKNQWDVHEPLPEHSLPVHPIQFCLDFLMKRTVEELPYDPANPHWGIYSDKTLKSKRYKHSYIDSSTIYNSQDLEMYVHQQMNG